MISIHGFGISSYRSFNEHEQTIAPFSKINIFIGKNNSGKSNILRYIRDVYPEAIKLKHVKTVTKDVPRGLPTSRRYQSFYLKKPENLRAKIRQSKRNSRNQDGYYLDLILGTNDFIEFEYDYEISKLRFKKFDFNLQNGNHRNAIRDYRSDIFAHSGGNWIDQHDHVSRHVFKICSSSVPNIHFIGAYRKYDSRLPEYTQDNGNHRDENDETIEDLNKLKNPRDENLSDRDKFENIEGFMRDITGKSELTLNIPHDLSTVQVNADGRVLPIEALGTGIHELLIFAIKVISVENCVFCIEEPELHFHPDLQRKFIRFLEEKTNNQYFIATHSAHIMDASNEVSIFSVRLEEGFSQVSRSMSSKEKKTICEDLGYRPSDLLQSNSAIWVEGPSDRIYLNYWLSTIAPSLVEGLHYSYIFYGGSVLKHLTADDKETTIIDDFLKILPLNRRPVLMMDSDCREEGAGISDVKIRVRDQLLENNGLSWITKGKEIENYIHEDIRLEAIKIVYPTAVSIEEPGEYGRPLYFKNKRGNVVKKANKVEIAREVVNLEPTLEVLDLKERIENLAEYIKLANDIREYF